MNSQCGVKTSTPSWFMARTMSSPRAPQRGGRALERVAAVEQQRAPGPLRAHAPHQRGEVRVAAHPAVARGQRGEVEVRERIRLGRPRAIPIGPEQRLPGEERRLPALVAARRCSVSGSR